MIKRAPEMVKQKNRIREEKNKKNTQKLKKKEEYSERMFLKTHIKRGVAEKGTNRNTPH